MLGRSAESDTQAAARRIHGTFSKVFIVQRCRQYS
jgi:hypothetical protein